MKRGSKRKLGAAAKGGEGRNASLQREGMRNVLPKKKECASQAHLSGLKKKVESTSGAHRG